MTQISTERMLLRPAREADAPALFEVYGREDTMRYWDSLPHQSVAQTAELVSGLVKQGDAARYFVVEHQGRAIGTAGFWRASEVGYILHPDFWGQGLGREVLEAMVKFGFGDCGFDFITAEVDPQNATSIRMLLGAGFVETGCAKNTIEIGGNWFDSIYYRLERDAGVPT